MESDRSSFCGCKGIRSCLKCESHFKIIKPPLNLSKNIYSYCPQCGRAVKGPQLGDHADHCTADTIAFPGVYIQPEFINEAEELTLAKALDDMPWDVSQSGRRKQNFGPKCNFKKRRLQLGSFNGFPEKTRFIQERFKNTEVLGDYQTIEQCSLEYDPRNGASIDPHIDDCWVWGERIVTVNLLSDSVLTLTPYKEVDTKRYNLELAPQRYRGLVGSVEEDVTVRVPMPRRSLLVLTAEARYCWEHCVLREDITERRVCLAYREFTQPYLPGGQEFHKSKPVLEMAKHFW